MVIGQAARRRQALLEIEYLAVHSCIPVHSRVRIVKCLGLLNRRLPGKQVALYLSGTIGCILHFHEMVLYI